VQRVVQMKARNQMGNPAKTDGRRFSLLAVLCAGAAALLLIAWFSGFIPRIVLDRIGEQPEEGIGGIILAFSWAPIFLAGLLLALAWAVASSRRSQ
jgi:hypothetical protein